MACISSQTTTEENQSEQKVRNLSETSVRFFDRNKTSSSLHLLTMAQAAVVITPERRKQVLKVLFISLLLDLVSRVVHCPSTGTHLTVLPLDLLHLHPPAVPQAPRILPRRRCLDLVFILELDPSLSRLSPPQCIQEHVCQTHQRPLRHCPVGRCTRLALFLLPGHCVTRHWPSVGSLRPSHSLVMEHGR